MRRVLALDVDGVLNHEQFYIDNPPNIETYVPYRSELDPVACERLRNLQKDIPDMEIVLSSSWRIGVTLEQSRYQLASALLTPDRLAGFTPDFGDGSIRGHEIAAWMSNERYREPYGKYQVDKIVILDDEVGVYNMDPFEEEVVYIDPKYGFTEVHAALVREKLR